MQAAISSALGIDRKTIRVRISGSVGHLLGAIFTSPHLGTLLLTGGDTLLQCMNCGNLFLLSAVGEASGGCTPLNVGDYSVSDTELTVSQSELKSAASVFANWKKGL